MKHTQKNHEKQESPEKLHVRQNLPFQERKSTTKSSMADSSMIISEALGNIDTRYIQEAAQCTPTQQTVATRQSATADPLAATHKKIPSGHLRPSVSRLFLRTIAAAAAALALCLVVVGIGFPSPSGKMTVTAHAQGTDEEITAAGVVISAGIIRDNGSMTGMPLSFYLSGENIAKVRFSCKNQQLDFTDYTEKRAEFGVAQNFTVKYGADASEYYYLQMDWVAYAISRELRTGCTIAGLPEELRNDVIVMEITFADGSTDIKAISVSLLDDGSFFASFDDYRPSDADTFIHRADSEPIPREILYAQGSDAPNNRPAWVEESPISIAQIAWAEEAARFYYVDTVYEVFSTMAETLSEDTIVFSVRVSLDGLIQDTKRTITLQLQDGEWKVINEG